MTLYIDACKRGITKADLVDDVEVVPLFDDVPDIADYEPPPEDDQSLPF